MNPRITTKSIIFLNFSIGIVTVLNVYYGRCIGAGKHCHCDEVCSSYGDCCYNPRFITPVQPFASCYKGYYVINKCDKHVGNEDWKGFCEDNRGPNETRLIFHVPVYGIYNNISQVYKNVFCAICNWREEYDFANITTETNNSVHIQYEVPDPFKRRCYDVIKTCPNNSRDIYKILCDKEATFYVAEKRGNSKVIYRNAYCYLCNKVISYLIYDIALALPNILWGKSFYRWYLSDYHSFLESLRINPPISENSSFISSCTENASFFLSETREMNTTQMMFRIPIYPSYYNDSTMDQPSFCAICNKNTQSEFSTNKPFKTLYPLINGINNNSFSIPYDIPDIFRHICYKEVISTCIKNSRALYKTLCHHEPAFYIVGQDSNIFRNAYCYLCNRDVSYTQNYINEALPVNIEAIDFNRWCLRDCHTLLQAFKRNQSILQSYSNNLTYASKNTILHLHKILFITLRSISMFCLICMIFIYGYIENQQTLAGKITISLAFSLLLLTMSNFFFSFVEQPSNRFCFFFSIAHHYCFLSSFAWMSIFAIDVYRSLTAQRFTGKRHPTIFTSKRFRIYSFMGYGSPLIVTITAVIIQLVNENNILSAGFGERQCFINRFIGGLVWLFIPLCICLLTNIVVCGCLYRFIYIANCQTAIATNAIKARKQSFVLCIKLSVLFGAVWLPAFVGIFLDNYVLKFVGGIFSSLQGAIFSFCLIFGVKVRRSTYEYFRRIRSSLSALTP